MEPRSYKVYQNKNSREIFDSDGEILANDSLPYIALGETIILDYNIITSDDPADAYTGFVGEAVSASAIFDDDFKHYIPGTLTTDKSGAVTEIIANLTEDDYINPTGQIQLINSSGQSESVDYTACSKNGTACTFTVNATLTYSYTSGNTVKISDTPLGRAISVDLTYKDTGRFLITINAKSAKYSWAIDNEETIENVALEFQLRDSEAELMFNAEFELLCLNVRDAQGIIPAPADNQYYTKTEIAAILLSYLTKDFSGYGTKATLVDADTLAANNSEDSGNIITVTLLKIWNYITTKRFPGAMTVGNLMKYGTGGTVEDAGVAVSTDGTLAGNSDANIPTEKAVKAYADTKEAALGFTPENVANKATDFSVVNNTLYTTVQAVKTYIDAAVVGLFDDRGNYDASVNTFPASGGSGDAGAILKGDIWTISVAGTLGGDAVSIGDQVRALADAPGQTASNWTISEANIGYVPENENNKTITITSGSTDTQYPSAKAVYDNFALKNNPEITGRLVLRSTSYDPATSGLWFGDADTGFYEYSDDTLILKVGGVLSYVWNANQFYTPNGAALFNLVSSETIPVIVPNNSDTDTGVGRKGDNVLTLIAGGIGSCNITINGIEVPGAIKTNTISELTTGAGVTIDGCLVKDGKVADVEGKADAQWNADKVQGVTIDDAAKADGKVLTYNSTSGNLEYATPPGAGGGEANTASNTGSSGVGIYKSKSGVDIQLYKLLGSDGVSITVNGTDYIDVKLNINGLTEITSLDNDNDYFPVYDASGTANKKVKAGNVGGGITEAQAIEIALIYG